MVKPRFNPEITWGHVMQLLVMAATAVALYGDARVYKVSMDYRVSRLEKSDAERAKQIANQTAATQALSKAVTALTVVVEERTSKRYQSPKLEERN